MTTRVQIKKTGSENAMYLLRKFSRRVQESGIIRTVKKRRYYSRKQSTKSQKASALHRIGQAVRHKELYKLGKSS